MCVQVHTPWTLCHVWSLEVEIRCLPLLLATLYFEAGFLTDPGYLQMATLAGAKNPRAPVSISPVLGLQTQNVCSSHGSGIELRSCAHTANTELPRAISPAGLILFTSCGFKYCFVSPVSVGTKSLTAFTDYHGSVGSVVIACPCHLYFLFLLISFMKLFRELFFHFVKKIFAAYFSSVFLASFIFIISFYLLWV